MTTISVSKRGKADKVFHLGNSEVLIKHFDHFAFMIDGALFTLFFDKEERQFEIRKGSKVLLSYRIPPEVRFSPVVVDSSEVVLSCNNEADFGDNPRCPCCEHSAPYDEFKTEDKPYKLKCPSCGTMALTPTQMVKYAFKHAVQPKFIPTRCQLKTESDLEVKLSCGHTVKYYDFVAEDGSVGCPVCGQQTGFIAEVISERPEDD